MTPATRYVGRTALASVRTGRRGNGTSANPLAIADGTNKGQMLFWDGTAWKISDASAPQNGDILQWNQAAGRWEPAGINVTNQAPLSDGSLWVGGTNDTAQELGLGQANQVLTVNRTGQSPEWSSTLQLDSVEANQLRVNGDSRVDGNLVVNGDTRLEGTFTANDSAVFNGPVRFAQFPTIGLTEHALVVGDANIKQRSSAQPEQPERFFSKMQMAAQHGHGTSTLIQPTLKRYKQAATPHLAVT